MLYLHLLGPTSHLHKVFRLYCVLLKMLLACLLLLPPLSLVLLKLEPTLMLRLTLVILLVLLLVILLGLPKVRQLRKASLLCPPLRLPLLGGVLLEVRQPVKMTLILRLM